MTKAIAFFVAGIVLLTLQSSIRQLWPALETVPDFALICVMYCGVYRNDLPGLLSVFVLGYAADIALGSPPGLLAAGFIIVFIASNLASRIFYIKSVWFQLVVAAVMTGVWRGSSYLMLSWMTGGAEYAPMVLNDLPYRIGANVLAAPFVFAFMFRLEEWTTRDYPGRMISAAL